MIASLDVCVSMEFYEYQECPFHSPNAPSTLSEVGPSSRRRQFSRRSHVRGRVRK